MRSERSDFIDGTATNVAAICGREQRGQNWRGKILPDGEWFPVMALELWREKVAANLQVFFIQGGAESGVSDRTLRSWACGASEPPATRLAFLLRSDDGPRVLAWIMRHDPPRWWREFQGDQAALLDRARRIFSRFG